MPAGWREKLSNLPDSARPERLRRQTPDLKKANRALIREAYSKPRRKQRSCSLAAKEIKNMKFGMRSKYVVLSLVFMSLFAVLLCSASCAAEAAKKKAPAKSSEKTLEKKNDFKVIAYYFHGAFRCATCRRLEELSNEAVKTGFPKELKGGVIEWRAVNVEEKDTEHFVQDYKLYTKSLVLAEMNGDKQVKWKNLEKIWDLVKDKEAFINYVQDEVKMYLADAPKNPEKKEKKKGSK